jgi:hypothetical protein
VAVPFGVGAELIEGDAAPPEVHPEGVDVEAAAGEALGVLQQAAVLGEDVVDGDRPPDEHRGRDLPPREVPQCEQQRVDQPDEDGVREDGQREDAEGGLVEGQRPGVQVEPRVGGEQHCQRDDRLGVGAAEAAEAPEDVAERGDQSKREGHLDGEEPLLEGDGVEVEPDVPSERDGADDEQRHPRPVRHPPGLEVPVGRPGEDGDGHQPDEVRAPREVEEHRREPVADGAGDGRSGGGERVGARCEPCEQRRHTVECVHVPYKLTLSAWESPQNLTTRHIFFDNSYIVHFLSENLP